MWAETMPAVTGRFTADAALPGVRRERCLAVPVAAGNTGPNTRGTLGESNMPNHDERIELLDLTDPNTFVHRSPERERAACRMALVA